MRTTNQNMKLPDSPDLAAYEGKYPKSLFNKGVRTEDEDHVGHVVKELADRIVIDGHYDLRFIVPKSWIIGAGRNVILGMKYSQLISYQVKRNDPLPEDH